MCPVESRNSHIPKILLSNYYLWLNVSIFYDFRIIFNSQSIAQVASEKNYFFRLPINIVIRNTDSQPIVQQTAKEFMFGYTSPLTTLGNQILPDWIYFDKVGLIDRVSSQLILCLFISCSQTNRNWILCKSCKQCTNFVSITNYYVIVGEDAFVFLWEIYWFLLFSFSLNILASLLFSTNIRWRHWKHSVYKQTNIHNSMPQQFLYASKNKQIISKGQTLQYQFTSQLSIDQFVH